MCGFLKFCEDLLFTKNTLSAASFFVVAISFVRVVVPSSKKTFSGLSRSYPVKENHIGLAISEILRYR